MTDQCSDVPTAGILGGRYSDRSPVYWDTDAGMGREQTPGTHPHLKHNWVAQWIYCGHPAYILDTVWYCKCNCITCNHCWPGWTSQQLLAFTASACDSRLKSWSTLGLAAICTHCVDTLLVVVAHVWALGTLINICTVLKEKQKKQKIWWKWALKLVFSLISSSS